MSSSIINLLPKLCSSLLERRSKEHQRHRDKGGIWNVHTTMCKIKSICLGLGGNFSMQLNGNSNHELGEGISSSAEADGLWSWAWALLSQGQTRLIHPTKPVLAIIYAKLFNKPLCHLITFDVTVGCLTWSSTWAVRSGRAQWQLKNHHHLLPLKQNINRL